jgi:hypothetical protein
VVFSFRPAEPGDRPAILSLFRTAFKLEPDPADWAWKYDRNPRSAVSVVADDGGRIVGFFGAMATRYRGAGGNLPGACSGDIMTDPAARALGKSALFRELGNAYKERNAAAGVPFDFGFPHERSGRVVEKLLGFVRFEPCCEVGRRLDAPGLVGRFRRRLMRIREGAAGDSAWAAFAERLHGRPGWRTDRSADVVAWRVSRPGVRYRVLRLLDLRGRCRGYAVTTLRDGRALLVDLQVADERSSDLPDLVGAVHATLQGSAAERVVFRSPRENVLSRRLREELGFLEEPSDTALHVRALAPGVDPATTGRSLDYRFWDHDVF